MIKININRKATMNTYDIHIPIEAFIKPNKIKKGAAAEDEILQLFKPIDKNASIMLCDNGGPPPRMEYIQGILKKNGYKIICIDRDWNLKKFSKKQKLFESKRPYRLLKLPSLKKEIKNLFNLYKTKKWKEEILEKPFLGHYLRSKSKWTQVQNNTNIDSCKNFILMKEMKRICKNITIVLTDILQTNGLNCKNFEDRLTLRLIDYPNTDKTINSTLQTHVDSSVISLMLYHDNPKLIVNSFNCDNFSRHNLTPHDISEKILGDHIVLLPGDQFSYEFQTFVPACWHLVQIPDTVKRRLSLIARIEEE